MIKGITTGTQIVQAEASDEILGGQAKTKTQFGIGEVSYASEKIKQQLGPIENEVTLMDEIKKQRLSDGAERTDVQQMQDMMGEASRAQQMTQDLSSKMENQKQPQQDPQSKSWWSEIWHFFSS